MHQEKLKIFAFIDSQNLNLAIREAGWTLDFRRFRVYLEERYGISKAYLFMGYVPGNESLYDYLKKQDYQIIFKPTLQNKKGAIKGNCDAELVLHCMIEYPNFDQAIIVSGDGDFHCLIEYLEKNSKLRALVIPNRRKYSALLRRFRKHFIFIDHLQKGLGK